MGDADGELLKGIGMNMVRLGVLITGTMPTADGINATYLSDAKDMVSTLKSHGIYTLLDAHQDVLSEKLCGEGIPDWLVDKGLELVGFNSSDASIAFPYPLPFDIDIDPNTGYPSVDTCMENGFFFYYMTLESEKLWHSIYSQEYMWDAFAVSKCYGVVNFSTIIFDCIPILCRPIGRLWLRVWLGCPVCWDMRC